MNWKIGWQRRLRSVFWIFGELSGVQKAVAGDTVALSAATKKKKAATRRQEPNQVACTELGCHPIPPGCHPQIGLQLGWNPDRLRYCCLSAAASPLKSGVNFRRFRG
jgi:hypothetical protein